ncbi:lactonase family protein [Puniceicoccaceae bacterium K14]|nr:lactonase family protein [Puniceicoccaceae bacterium K14]
MAWIYMTMLNVYYGTAHAGDDAGIYTQTLEIETGSLGTASLAAPATSAGFQAINAAGTLLYSICANDDGKGVVRAYSIERSTGALTLINEQLTGGGKPTYVGLSGTERSLFAVCYGEGSLSVLPVSEDGSIEPYSVFKIHEGGSGAIASRQGEAHTHSIYTDPTNQYVFVCDLGADKIFIYKFDQDDSVLIGDPIEVATAVGAGPRHLAFHPNGEWVYVLNELNSTMTQYSWDAAQAGLAEKGTLSTLPEGFSFEDNLTAEVVVSADGRFVYGSNRGHDSIAVFAINEKDGSLTLTQIEATRGGHPRNFNLDPTGNFLVCANRDSDNVTLFKRDSESGKIEYTGYEVSVPSGICVSFVSR